MNRSYFFLFAVLFAAQLTNAQSNANIKLSQTSSIAFTENKGQVHDQFFKTRGDVLFAAMSGPMSVFLKNKGVSYQLYKVVKRNNELTALSDEKIKIPENSFESIYRVDLSWINANTHVQASGVEALPGKTHFYLESCPEGALNVKTFRQVMYKNLYKGISLHYYEKGGELKHDYLVSAYHDYKQIQIRVEGAEVSVKADGSLVFDTPLGKIQEGAPIVFQQGRQLKAKWTVSRAGGICVLAFDIADVRPELDLIIDPVTRLWGTYYGGSGPSIAGDDKATSCVTDVQGNVFMCGYTSSGTTTLIATVGSHQAVNTGTLYSYDGFTVKFNAGGVRLWGTYYGASSHDFMNSCALDTAGNLFVAGTTTLNTTTVLSTPGCHQPNYVAGYEAFLVKFNTQGIRLWGTYYGGFGEEQGLSCATDVQGNVFLSGNASSTTNNTSIATPGSHQSSSNYGDAFLAKFNSAGVRQWGTYYGNTYLNNNVYSSFSAKGCCTDPNGNVYLAGTFYGSATHPSLSTVGVHQPAFGGTISSQGADAMLAKFDANGVRLWSTYYGTAGNEEGLVCHADGLGNVYLGGYASANLVNTNTIIATSGSQQLTNQGYEDGFLVKFTPNGNRIWGTYYGGNHQDRIHAISSDVNQNVYIAGLTQSFLFNGVISGIGIANPGGYQDSLGGMYLGVGIIQADAFVAKLNSNGVRQWGTYYGGQNSESGGGCSVDLYGHVYLCGFTATNTNTVIASFGSHQSSLSPGNNDAFLVKFDQCNTAPLQPLSVTANSLICYGNPINFYVPPATAANFYTVVLPGGSYYTSTTNTIALVPITSGVYTVMAGNACGVSPQKTLNITVNPSPTLSINSGSICAGQSFTFTVGGALTYTLSSPYVISPAGTDTYTLEGTNSLGCSSSAIAQVIVHPSPFIVLNYGTICEGSSFTINPFGAYTYTYSGGQVVSPTVTTTYSVHGVSQAGCVSSNTAVCTIVVNPAPQLLMSASHPTLCAGEEATISVAGAVSYTFDPGGISSSVVVTPSVTTVYTVSGTNSLGCSDTLYYTQIVDACLGLHSGNSGGLRSMAKVYPNPGSGIFYVDAPMDAIVECYSSIGLLVWKQEIKAGQKMLDLHELPNGVYLLSFRSQNQSQNLKLIKN